VQEIETEAEHHRAGAAAALSGLAHRLAPERIGHDAVSQGAQIAGDFGRSALSEVKRNPAGIALIGIGAAVILSGMGRKRAPQTALGTEAERIAAADARIKAKARITAAAPASSASSMRSLLDKGLDHLPYEARQRVTKARLKAVDAQEAVERHAKRAAAQASAAHNERPFATGLIAAGVGGLIGALLPSTRTESTLLGAKRDQLMREAEAVLRAEIADLEARSKSAVTAGADAMRGEFDPATRH